MKILITGGAGFIGSHLTDKLIEQGHKVVVIDNLSTGKEENLNKQARFYNFDIRDEKISNVFKQERPEVVFHYAAQVSVKRSIENPVRDADINITGTLNILENCKKFGVKKIIFASTGGAIYGETDTIPTSEKQVANPRSPYGFCKLAVENYLYCYFQNFNLPFVALRFSNVYGPKQNPNAEAGVIAIFFDRVFLGKDLIINGDGQQTRDYVFIKDAIKANLLALEKDKTGIFNIGTAQETSVNDIFQKINHITDKGLKSIYCSAQPGEERRSCLDFSKAQKELGWNPEYKLEQGLKETYQWYQLN